MTTRPSHSGDQRHAAACEFWRRSPVTRPNAPSASVKSSLGITNKVNSHDGSTRQRHASSPSLLPRLGDPTLNRGNWGQPDPTIFRLTNAGNSALIRFVKVDLEAPQVDAPALRVRGGNAALVDPPIIGQRCDEPFQETPSGASCAAHRNQDQRIQEPASASNGS